MKYGILTDGYEWRFYIGSRYYPLTIYDLLKEDSSFKTFWKDYIKVEKYYLFYFDHHEQGRLFKDDPKDIELEIGIFFDNITSLIKKFRDKLNLEKYFTDAKDYKEREKRATEITYAYIIQFILYKVLVDNKFTIFKDNFDGIREAITEALKQPSGVAFNGILNLITRMTEQISKNIYRPFAQEQQFISKKLGDILTSPKNTILDIAPWLDMFVFIDGFTFQNVKNEIFGHVYENYLKDLYAEENRGQYFTHPAVVDFMLKEIGYTEEILKENNYQDMSIIDPSCGSGTFLYKIVDIIVDSFGNDINGAKKRLSQLIHENVFGLDVEEFPLYLAEMSILMRMLPYIVDEKHNNAMDKKIKVFKTRDSVSEFIGEAQESDTLFTVELGLGYDSFMRDNENLEELKDSLKGINWKSAIENQHLPRRRFNYVIGNPPYIGGIECIRQNVLIYSLIHKKQISLSNIYNVNLHSTPFFKKRQPPLANLNLWNMFIPLGYGLLKDNGKMSYIIPQNLLYTKTVDVLRYLLSYNMIIEIIYIFPDKLFVSRGIKTKKDITTSSLIFIVKKSLPEKEANNIVELTKYISEINNNISIESYIKDAEHTTIKIEQKKLQFSQEWTSLFNIEISTILNTYKEKSLDIRIYYDHTKSKVISKDQFYFDGFYEYDTSCIKSSFKSDDYVILNLSDNYYNYNLNTQTIQGYLPNLREDNSENPIIKCRKANQKYYLLDSPYKIIWRNARTKHFLFCESNKIILWGQNFSGIASKNKKELLYLYHQ